MSPDMTDKISLPLQFSDEIICLHPPSVVWPVLANFADYSNWWPKFLFVRILHSEPNLIGTEFVIRPYGWRSFLCRVTSFEEPSCICLQYDSNYMRGTAEWRLEPVKQGSKVIYEMDAVVDDIIVYLVSYISSLQSIHSYSMRGVLQNLTKQLSA